MSFQIYTIEAMNKDRILAYNHLNESLKLTTGQIYFDELPFLKIGSKLIVEADGTIELATPSFVKWAEGQRNIALEETIFACEE